MNNTFLLLAVGAIVVVGGGYFLFSNSSGSNTGESMMEESASGTFASLIARGQNLECTFEHNDGTNVSSGTVYLANGATRIRGNFTIEQSGAGPMEAHMIRDGGYNYIWGSFYPQGIKSKVSAEEEGKLFSTKEGSGIDEDTTFDCKPWNVNASVFSLPSGVGFMDMSMQMGGEDMNNTLGDLDAIKAQQCASGVCNQAPEGVARQQCLQALGCI